MLCFHRDRVLITAETRTVPLLSTLLLAAEGQRANRKYPARAEEHSSCHKVTMQGSVARLGQQGGRPTCSTGSWTRGARKKSAYATF